MDIKAVSGDVASLKTSAVVVNLFEGVKRPGGATGAVDRALGGAISQLIAEGEIKGKKGEVVTIHTLGKIPPARVTVAGLGKDKDFNADVVRWVMGEVVRHLGKMGIKQAATIVHGAGIGDLPTADATRALVEGAILGSYSFKRHKSKNDNIGTLVELQIVEKDASKLPDIESGIQMGRTVAEAANFARDLVNEPANLLTPSDLANVAKQMAQEVGLEVTILEKPDMEKLGMGALLGVAKGSVQPPKFIVLRYWGDKANSSKVLGLVGKGITFDTGGISLKPAEGMSDMKGDMAGGASVVAAMKAIGELKPKINVTGLVPASENMPDAAAQKPGDLVKALNGKTIEVENTDAEGRLLLADALSYGRSLGLSPMIDVATLTGAMKAALGNVCTGGFTNHQPTFEALLRASAKTGEKVWQFPLYEEYKEMNHSEVADMKNTGGRFAGSITAAHFLGEFAEDTPWVHLDIAGTARSDSTRGHLAKGATAVPMRTLVQLALDMASG